MATPRTNAGHDENYAITLLGVSTANGTTPVPVEVDPTTGQLQVFATTNATQIGSTTVSVGNGTTDAGTQRVTLSSDSSGQVIVLPSSSTGSAVPTKAFYMGLNSGGNLTGMSGTAPSSDGIGSMTGLASIGYPTLYNGTNFSRTYQVTAAINSTGTGIQAIGIVAQLDDTSPTAITENSYGSVRISSDRSLLTTQRSITPVVTSVGGSATNVNLLASNTARKGATITNDSSAVMYLKLGATASTTSYTTTLAGSASAPFTYYEVPFGYIGAIDAIWASATGNARITELT